MDDLSLNMEEPMPESEPDNDVLKAEISSLVYRITERDKSARETLLRQIRKSELFWRGVQRIFWNESVGEWQAPDGAMRANPDIFAEGEVGERIVNFYRSHGESVIAALSTGLPVARFSPDDADNPDDLMTAKAFTKIAEIIQMHNQAPLLLLKALYILWNQPFVAMYNCTHTDPKYGLIEEPVYEMVAKEIPVSICPSCGREMGSTEICPTCGETPMMDSMMTQEYAQTGTKKTAKSREILEVYGPANVSVAPYATKLSNSPYLMLETDHHRSVIMEMFPDFVEAGQEDEGRSSRLITTRGNDVDTEDIITLKRVWLRPYTFNMSSMKDELKKAYPNGLYVVMVGSNVYEMIDENVDDHWTLTEHPLSSTVHADPLGSPLIPVQEMTNDLISLTMDTIEHGIPETFADPDVLDFTAYSESEAAPGMMYPARARSGMGLDSSFHTIKTATLSKEVEYFQNSLEKFGQQVVGAMPSVWGGSNQGGSGTLGEYEMSRNMALQRLSITWKMINVWWAEFMKKATMSFKDSLKADERFTKKSGTGYINVWIRRSEMTGQIGNVEPEVSEQFPMSWAQKRGMLLELLNLQNEAINSAIFHPENVSTIAGILGFTDLHIPGDQDRNKQLAEIAELLSAEPMMDPMGMQPPMPSIQPEMQVDSHSIHAETCRAWLTSAVGLEAKMTNPAGYSNVLAHMMAHLMLEQQEMMQSMPPQPGQAGQTDGAEQQQTDRPEFNPEME